MWNCKNCHEAIEDNFDACWKCGTGKDGTPDPNFGREEVPVANQKRLAEASKEIGRACVGKECCR